MKKSNKRVSYFVNAVLIALFISILIMPYFTSIARASGIDTLLTVPGQTAKLIYEYVFSLSLMVGNTPVRMFVVQNYIINVENYNRTHVEVSGGPIGNISVQFLSNSWISITALMKTMSQNVTKLIEGLSLRTIHPSLISKNDFSYELAKVMYVSPIVTLSGSASCVNLSLNGVTFEATEISSGANGIAYYECKTGVLLKYTSKIARDITNGNVTLHVIKNLNVSLIGGDKETLKLLGGTQLTRTTSNVGRQGFVISPPIMGLLVGSIVAFVASLYFFIKIYRSTHHQK